MGLEELNKDIYKRGYESSRDMTTPYDPGRDSDLPGEVPFSSQEWQMAPPAKKRGVISSVFHFFFGSWRRTLPTLLVFIIIAIGAIVPSVRTMLFTTANVSVTVSGPKEVASGEIVKYSFEYSNRNILGVKNAELRVSFPDAFRAEAGEYVQSGSSLLTIPIGELAGKSVGRAEISGKFYGLKGELVYPKVIFRYTPSNMGGAFETEAQIGVTIALSPLAIDIIVPQEVASGNEVTYIVNYRNDSDVAFSGLRINAEYPDGFHFSDADPAPSEGDAVWKIGNVLPHGSGSITVRGTLSGTRDQAKVFRAVFGVVKGDGTFLAYDQGERVTRVVASPLSITQTVNGKIDLAVNPGEALTYRLRYSNDGSVGLRDVIIAAEVNSPFLDMATLSPGVGKYDAANKRIVWRASDVPGLSLVGPQQSGEVAFSVSVRKDIGTSGTVGKSLSIQAVAKIDSPDIALRDKVSSSNILETKVNSIVFFDVNGYYFDAAVLNSGPIPPKAGQETTYTIHLVVTNYLNDLGQAKVTASLPTGVKFLGKKLSEAESIDYNDRSGAFVWNIGNIPGGGKNVREVIFQVAVTPAPNEVGSSSRLLQNAVFEGTDLFTNHSFRIERGSKTMILREDTNLPSSGYIVVASE